jgi:hypothetical protein
MSPARSGYLTVYTEWTAEILKIANEYGKALRASNKKYEHDMRKQGANLEAIIDESLKEMERLESERNEKRAECDKKYRQLLDDVRKQG